MAKVKVLVTSGLGFWTAIAETTLVACPHVGDRIEVNGVTIDCEIVTITKDMVYVNEKRRFESEQDAREFQDALTAK